MIRNLSILVCLLFFTPAALAEKLVFVTSSKADFSHPHDLTLGPNKRYLFVADMNHHVIRVLDPASLQTLATIGDGELSAPHDVAFAANGQMLVADSGNDRIAIYALNELKGKLVAELSRNMSSPEGVSSDAENNIYVANAGNNLIQKFRNGKLIKSMGGYGSVSGKFNRAHDLEYFKDKLYVADPGNNRVQILDNLLRPLKIFQATDMRFNEPKYLALDNEGKLYVADQYNNTLRVFSLNNKEIARVAHAGNKALNKIEGVEVYNNKVWISDTYNNRIVLFHWQKN